MRGKVAKALRKQIYGSEFSYRDKKYRQDGTGKIYCSGRRALYKQLKKNFKESKKC